MLTIWILGTGELAIIGFAFGMLLTLAAIVMTLVTYVQQQGLNKQQVKHSLHQVRLVAAYAFLFLTLGTVFFAPIVIFALVTIVTIFIWGIATSLGKEEVARACTDMINTIRAVFFLPEERPTIE